MSATRITNTLDDETARELKRHVAAGQVSAFAVGAIRQRSRAEPVRALLHDLDDLHGPLTPST